MNIWTKLSLKTEDGGSWLSEAGRMDGSWSFSALLCPVDLALHGEAREGTGQK